MSPEMNRSHDHLSLERKARARPDDGRLSNPEPLTHYSDVQAWVLIADPGAGKTDAFETLSKAEGGYFTKACDFVELDLPSNWTPPIFIDGLDEMTAGNATGSTALGQIRSKLQKLGTPRFRISCREADWRGNTDSAALRRLVGDRGFLELHLEPLDRSQETALIAHWQQSSETAAADFIREAENRDLEGLLDNPQTLRMLVEAMATTESGWPYSKTQTYELACAQLVREHNEEWLAATRNSPLSDDKVLHAAGYLSAIMLLSGNATIALQRHVDTQSGIVALPELVSGSGAPDMASCQAALQTRLFRGNGRGEFWPVHRTVAEYLGAQYLVSRIHAGLPINRVLALMLGLDAGVVPELRGLHAWLAATAPTELRRELIDHDPLGVVLNGDARNFSRPEKLHVLKALLDEAMRYTHFRSQYWASNPLGALATADMREDFRAWFHSPDRSPAHLSLVDLLLDALAHGLRMPELAPSLERIVRDETYWSGSRKVALKILVAYAGKDDNWSSLTQLLADIHGNAVEDLEDELLGKLLQAFYPFHLSPAEVWQYFRKPEAENLLGSYWRFWHDLSKETALNEDVPVLLDALLATGYQLSNQHDSLDSADIVGELLVRGVTQHGIQIEVQRLYCWLSLGLGPYHQSPFKQQHKAALGQWLTEHPSVFKALFEHGLNLEGNTNESTLSKLWKIRAQLYEALEPDDAECWYLSLAEASPDDDLRRQLLLKAFRAADQKKGPDTAIQMLEEWSAGHAIDAAWVEDFLRCVYPPPESEQEHIDFEIKYKNQEAEAFRQKVNFFRDKLPGFVDGPAHLGALVEVANAYLNFFRHSNEKTPDARLFELLNQDKEWVRLALHGLRQSLFRADLPSAAEIVDLTVKGQRYNLAAPCLAAMELRYAENPQSALDLPPSTLETVAAFRLTNNFYETPAWFKQLLAQRPAILVTDMQRLISHQIASKAEHVEGLYALARDAAYATVAKQITPKLIADFPAKASEKQLKNLRLLIVAVLGHLDRDTQLKLIANKLSAKVMDVAQQVYWLTAGVLLAPELYLERTQQFVEKTQLRASHLFALIQESKGRGGLRADLPAPTQAFLIALLGPRSSPREAPSGRAYIVTPAIEMSEYVKGLISAFAGNPDDAALQALTALQQRQDMKHWADSLSRALYDQRITRRKALFRPASVAQVCATLANLKPANAADLWALTVAHLKQLLGHIRNGNTDDFLQYWAGDHPKLEDDCRNALLSDLKPLLARLGVTAEPEGIHADKTRADIKVIAPPYQIPIEIKREMHPDIWKAIPEQLVAKYGRELASDGYGIFMVFWFTGKLTAAPSDGGSRPKTPLELQQRLAATVPEELRHKIAVLVVDCSRKK